jgi:hypothetical protein
MKKIHSLVACFLAIAIIYIIYGCGGAETKVSPPDKKPTDTQEQVDNTRRPVEEKIPEKVPAAPSAKTGGKNDEILANIDQHLVSKASFNPPPASGGISNATVTVQNTLTDITIQKAILEVSILMADGAEFRTDYYVLQNIEPGDVETVKIPNAARGNSIVSHVVKLKSDQLTNGEMILVGARFVGK